MTLNDPSTTQLVKTLPQFGQNQMLYSKQLLKIFHRSEITQLDRCLAQVQPNLLKNTASIWSK